ncbi:MAG: aminotransferase class I/II-fold pyridoxal phosphate-dependent enzyme [Myxococcales bacterium]|nr:aminotransferase class I/II-fold pyridoxal phosphate-dependent enzyme [Myxococcales bacterium]
MSGRVALAIDDLVLRSRLASELGAMDVSVEHAPRGERWWERLPDSGTELVVVSLEMVPQPHDEMIALLCAVPSAPGVVVVGEVDADARARLHAAGCLAVLDSAAASLAGALRAVLDNHLELVRRRERDEGPLGDEPRLSDFVIVSPMMRTFMATVERVVASDVSLLILGETGVGKERLARAVHAASPRAQGPFVAINCGALPETLLESELFGHVEGAFTGAHARRGCFELADGGTVFLDEIGELPHHLQVKLLRVLQDRQVRRLGSERSISVDLRVMAATNRTLDTEDKPFRSDLYYRLTVMTLTLPPLRERREDIPEMARRLVELYRARVGRSIDGISERAVQALTRYDWPGNVRELGNVIERAMLLCRTTTVDVGDLPEAIGAALRDADKASALGRAVASPSPALSGAGVLGADEALPRGEPSVGEMSLEGTLLGAGELEAALEAGRSLREIRGVGADRVERAYLARLLTRCRGRVGETAARAGIKPRALYNKMQRHGLRKEDFRLRDTAPKPPPAAAGAASSAVRGPRATLFRAGLPDGQGFTVSAAPTQAKLDQNEAPWPLPEALHERLLAELSARPLHRYPQPAEYAETKARFASALGLDAERVLLVAGADQLIATLVQAAGGARRRMRLFEPTYPMYRVAAKNSGTPVDEVILDARYEISESMVDVDAEIVVLVSPNNPTGTTVPRAVIRRALARDERLVIVDEAYADFAEESALDLGARHDNLFIVRSLSKSLLAGARLGYGVGHPELVRTLEAMLVVPYNLSHLQMVLADNMLSLRAVMRERARAVRDARDGLRGALAQRGLVALPSQGNFLCLELPRDIEAPALYEALCARGARLRDVSSMPGLAGYLRVTVGTAEMHEHLLAALDESLAALRGG